MQEFLFKEGGWTTSYKFILKNSGVQTLFCEFCQIFYGKPFAEHHCGTASTTYTFVR